MHASRRTGNERQDRIYFHAFPLANVDAMQAATDRSFPRHTHENYGIGVIDAGSQRSWSGRGLVQADAGALITVNPGEVHDGHAVDALPRAWRMLYVDTSLLHSMWSELREGADGDFTFVAPTFRDARVRHRFNAAFALCRTDRVASENSLAAETAVLQLVASLRSHAATMTRRRTGVTGSIDRIRDRIHAEPATAFTLAGLARDEGMSRYQLIRAFAREAGLTPHAYIMQQRLALARRLLRADHPIATVAALAGFSDQSHLTRSFVRHVGATPGEYALRRR